LGAAAGFGHVSGTVMQIGQPGGGFFGGGRGLRGLLGQGGQAVIVGTLQIAQVGLQLVAAMLGLAQLLGQVALVGGQHLNLLLHLGDAAALGIGAGLRLAQGVFQGRGLGGGFFELGGQQFGLRGAALGLRLQLFDVGVGINLPLLPLLSLLGQHR
jgi:hypothetical protein